MYIKEHAEKKFVRPNPLSTIQNLIRKRYADAKAVFWAGSVSSGSETKTSDLDLVIVFDHVPNAYREAFIYDSWPIDAFIHDPETLDYFYNFVDLPSFIPALPSMIAYGTLLKESSELGIQLQQKARELLREKPTVAYDALLNRRFHITDGLDDLKGAKTRHEFMAIKYNLYQQLAEFYLLANGRWIGSGKHIAKLLASVNSELADEFYHNFQRDDVQALEEFIKKILDPYGGLLWNGFKLDAPKKWRTKSIADRNHVLHELKQREPLFHHPDKFGTSKQDLLNMTCGEFWEVGASGNVYNRDYVIEVLLDRYSDPAYKDVWETKDFELIEIAPNNYLITYVLLQGERITRRATLWRYEDSNWKILYHQGTVVQNANT